STFQLRRQADVTDLIEESGSVAGVRVGTPGGPLEVRGDLVVGAGGRDPIVRAEGRLSVEEFCAPMGVLWFCLFRAGTAPGDCVGRFDTGRIFIMLNRGDYWQCGFVIPKGSRDQLQEQGLPAFHAAVAQLAPFMSDRVGELHDWEQIKLLTVQVDRLRQWY